MTLYELREREQQARKRLGCGCDNPAEWEIEAFDLDGMVEAEHELDGVNFVLSSDGMVVSLRPGYQDEVETLRGFAPAETLIEMFKELRATIGPAKFEEIYGGIDGSH